MVNWMLLPVEIWVEIANLLPLSDLADLGVTSSQVISITRPILYRDLTLNTIADVEPNEAAADTFALLARDPELAKSVRVLTLDGGEEEDLDINDTPILVHVASLRNMSQLKSLRIIGHIFRYADEDMKADFIDALRTLPLEELSMPYGNGCLEMFSEGQVGQIANLKHFECRAEIDLHEYFKPRCLRLLANSASTLTSLSLSVMYIDSEWALELFNLRFPLLQSLTFGTWDEEMHCPEGLHAFLLAHNGSLEHLSMGYSARREVNPTALVFSEDESLSEDDTLQPHFLPNLESFKGHCKTVQAMAQARVHSLAGPLAKLTIGVCCIQNPKSDIDEMLDAVQAMPSALSALKELDFDFFENDEGELEWIPAFIRRWGQICGPSLEIWRGLVPSVWSWSPEEFASFFEAFAKMRVLFLANNSTIFGVFPKGDDGEEAQELLSIPEFEEYLRQLAQKCPALEEVILAHDSCWKIERNPLVIRQTIDW
ncbi:hypothetical protein C8R46DRAFT_224583 [Mycena filopes]|nr:hypothetical protein C8R46DRAFT_224583 [Mycena filopes]